MVGKTNMTENVLLCASCLQLKTEKTKFKKIYAYNQHKSNESNNLVKNWDKWYVSENCMINRSILMGPTSVKTAQGKTGHCSTSRVCRFKESGVLQWRFYRKFLARSVSAAGRQVCGAVQCRWANRTTTAMMIALIGVIARRAPTSPNSRPLISKNIKRRSVATSTAFRQILCRLRCSPLGPRLLRAVVQKLCVLSIKMSYLDRRWRINHARRPRLICPTSWT